MKYLSPLAYELSDDGMSLSDVPPLTLARTIQRAESDIDSHMEFDLRTGGFEPHNIWVQGQWDAKTLRFLIPNYPVPARNVIRYRIQVSNVTSSGAGFFATISPNDVALNVFDDYLEAVPLQSVTYSLAPVLIQLGLRPPIVQVDAEMGYFLPSWGETLLQLGTDYKTYIASRGFWATLYTQALSIQPNTLPPIPPVVYKNGVPIFAASLSSAITAGTAYTSLSVNALPAAIAGNSTLIVNDGSGSTATAVTVGSAGASIGAVSIPITSFTPSVSYGIGTVFASGYAANYTEGQVIFSSANLSTDIIKSDYTFTIPDNVRDACILQTSYLLQQRALNKMGMGGLELVRNGDMQIKRPTGSGATIEEDTALCLAAARKLDSYLQIPVA